MLFKDRELSLALTKIFELFSPSDYEAFDEEEIEFLKTDIDDWEKQIAEIKSDYLKKNEKADWEKEVEKVNEWWKAKERLINE